MWFEEIDGVQTSGPRLPDFALAAYNSNAYRDAAHCFHGKALSHEGVFVIDLEDSRTITVSSLRKHFLQSRKNLREVAAMVYDFMFWLRSGLGFP